MRIKELDLQYMRDGIFRFVSQEPAVTNSPDRSWFSFIFDRRFADRRHTSCVFANQWRSVLSVLLEVLSDQERQRIFSGVFDMGNGLEVPHASRTYAALERDLAFGRKGDEPFLKPIKRRLSALLNIPVQKYFDINPDITLKVLKLIFRYQNGIDGGLSSQKLFSFLELRPQRRPSLEFHPSFEINGAPKIEAITEKQRILEELTVHLGSELGAELREKVRSIFMGLTNDVAWIEIRLKQKLLAEARGSIQLYRQFCAAAQKRIERLRDECRADRVIQRLDLDLLIFLSRVQIENRNNAQSEVVAAINRLKLPIQEIEADIIKINKNFDAERQGRAVNMEVIRVSHFDKFVIHWADQLRGAMGKALDTMITQIQYEYASGIARKIMLIDPQFVLGVRGLTLLDVLGLLCISHASAKNGSLFRYKPYWHGQRNQSDRPFYQLHSRDFINPNAIPEGRVAYWRHCQTWIKSALIGQLPFYEVNLELTDCLDKALVQVMSSHNLEYMQNFVTSLDHLATD